MMRALLDHRQAPGQRRTGWAPMREFAMRFVRVPVGANLIFMAS